MLILFLKLQHYTLTFLHLVLFSLHIFNFPTFPSFPFLSFFFTPFSFPFLSFFFTPFSILLHTFLSPLFFLYTFPSYFLTFPTHCLTVPKLILLYLLFHITILIVNIASCQATVPYFIWQLLISLVPLLNYCVIQPYCAITVPLSIIY